MRNNLKVLTSTAQGYYIGLLKDYDHPEHVILQARRDRDRLSCELWVYLDRRLVTKRELKARRADLLKAINQTHNTNFTRITID